LEVAAEAGDVAELEAGEVAELEAALLEVPLAHSSCWRPRAAACSVVVQLAMRHFWAACWNWVFVHTQEILVKLAHPPDEFDVAPVRQPLMQGVMPLGNADVAVPLDVAALAARAETETKARSLKLPIILR